jgi:hypothetical protein
MQSLISLPFTQVKVRQGFLQQYTYHPEDKLIDAYLVAVCTVLHEAPKLMVMTEEGAMFCYVPPHAICFDDDAEAKSLEDVCRWDCLADRGEIVILDFVKDFGIRWKTKTGEQMEGRYLFSLHFDPRQAWGRIPEQLKIFHFVHGDDDNLHIVVNNQSQWLCSALSDGTMTVVPESNTTIWYSE